MNREFQLWLTKLFINVPMRFADKFLSFPKKPLYPQTRMLNNIYVTLQKVYLLECEGRIFGAEPDANFERLLRVAAKLMCRISESDRYYRCWIGLFMLLAREQLEKMDTSPATLKRLIKMQWTPHDQIGVDFVPDEVIEQMLKFFVEMALCEHLGNLARMNPNKRVGFLEA